MLFGNKLQVTQRPACTVGGPAGPSLPFRPAVRPNSESGAGRPHDTRKTQTIPFMNYEIFSSPFLAPVSSTMLPYGNPRVKTPFDQRPDFHDDRDAASGSAGPHQPACARPENAPEPPHSRAARENHRADPGGGNEVVRRGRKM